MRSKRCRNLSLVFILKSVSKKVLIRIIYSNNNYNNSRSHIVYDINSLSSVNSICSFCCCLLSLLDYSLYAALYMVCE